MNPQLLMFIVKSGADLIREGITQARLAKADGAISAEQLAEIEKAAQIADSAWDAAVAKAKG